MSRRTVDTVVAVTPDRVVGYLFVFISTVVLTLAGIGLGTKYVCQRG